VKSQTQSGMVDKLGELYDVPVHTTQVGFKYLGPVMMEVDALAAGEESGGYAFRGNIPERDGILSALLFLELMVQTGKRPSELVEWLYEKTGPFYYDRWDVPLDPEHPTTLKKMLDQAPPDKLAGLPVLRRDTLDGVYHALEGGYWGLVRFSGTEPLVRLYAEADSPGHVQSVLGDMRSMLGL
jgi:phosphomannomutase